MEGKLILASGSPRRRELLGQIGAAFEVITSAAEEVKTAASPRELVLENARRKALAVARKCPGRAVLGADTVVALAGNIYGKPQDEADARRMLHDFSGRTHEVLTGLALVRADGELFSAAEATEVAFAKLDDEEIRRYVETGEPMDKAGGYAVQGRAAVFIKGIRGSYSNVVGLPLHLLAELARKARVDLYGHHGAGSPRG